MTPDQIEAIESTAVHEAGHAVIACVLGIQIFEVTIVPNSSKLGNVEVVPPDVCRAHWKYRGKIRPDHYAIDARAIVCMAGGAAEMFFPVEYSCGDEKDFAEVEQLIPDEKRQDRLYRATEMLVERHASRIEAVAAALREHGTLEALDVEALISDFKRPHRLEPPAITQAAPTKNGQRKAGEP